MQDEVYHDINILRSIRNKFAHLRVDMKFDDKAITDQCNALLLVSSEMNGRPARSKFINAMTNVHLAIASEAKLKAFQPPSIEETKKGIRESGEFVRKSFEIDD